MAEDLELVDSFVSSVIAGIWMPTGMLVRQDRTISLHGGETGEVLRGMHCSQRHRHAEGRFVFASDAMSSSLVTCLHISLSMMVWTSGSLSAKGWYKTLF